MKQRTLEELESLMSHQAKIAVKDASYEFADRFIAKAKADPEYINNRHAIAGMFAGVMHAGVDIGMSEEKKS